MTAEDLRAWLDAYERLWRTAGTEALGEIFTDDVVYRPGPYDDAVTGRAALDTFWEAERDGPDEAFTLTTAPVTIEGDTAVVRAEVDYAGPPSRQYRDLWIITLAGDGRARSFEEWPFAPGQPRTADGR